MQFTEDEKRLIENNTVDAIEQLDLAFAMAEKIQDSRNDLENNPNANENYRAGINDSALLTALKEARRLLHGVIKLF